MNPLLLLFPYVALVIALNTIVVKAYSSRAIRTHLRERGIATRYDKLAPTCRGGAVLRAITLWLERSGGALTPAISDKTMVFMESDVIVGNEVQHSRRFGTPATMRVDPSDSFERTEFP